MPDAKLPLRFCLTSFEHDHAGWTTGHILETPAVSLVGVADRSPQRLAKARASLPGTAEFFEDAAAMLDALQPDALIVTAPNNEHRALLELCAARQVHCFIQKPIATSASDALHMQAIATQAGIQLMVNCYPLWDPLKAELFRRVKAGDIGQVQQMTMVNGHMGPKDLGVLTDDYVNWLYDPIRHGGGTLMDQGTYGLLYAAWVLGMPDRVSSTHVILKGLGTSRQDDMCTTVLSYPSATAVVIASWAWPHGRDEVLVYGSQGSLCYREGVLLRTTAALNYRQPQRPEQISAPAPTPPASRHGIAYFSHCLQHHIPIAEPHNAGLNVMVCEMVEQARLNEQVDQRVDQRGDPR